MPEKGRFAVVMEESEQNALKKEPCVQNAKGGGTRCKVRLIFVLESGKGVSEVQRVEEGTKR